MYHIKRLLIDRTTSNAFNVEINGYTCTFMGVYSEIYPTRSQAPMLSFPNQLWANSFARHVSYLSSRLRARLRMPRLMYPQK